MSSETLGPLARLARSARKHGVLGSLRVLAVVASIVVLLVLSRPTPASVAAGAPFVLLGAAFRVWAAGHLLKSRELAVSGPYRHVQNPLYFGRLCLLTGFSIMAFMPVAVGGRTWPANLLALLIGLALFFLYYLPRKRRVEGERLERLHGEAWRRYAEAVPLIIPSPRPWGSNVRRWTAERFHDNSEGLMLALIAGVSALFLWRALAGV